MVTRFQRQTRYHNGHFPSKDIIKFQTVSPFVGTHTQNVRRGNCVVLGGQGTSLVGNTYFPRPVSSMVLFGAFGGNLFCSFLTVKRKIGYKVSAMALGKGHVIFASGVAPVCGLGLVGGLYRNNYFGSITGGRGSFNRTKVCVYTNGGVFVTLGGRSTIFNTRVFNARGFGFLQGGPFGPRGTDNNRVVVRGVLVLGLFGRNKDIPNCVTSGVGNGKGPYSVY